MIFSISPTRPDTLLSKLTIDTLSPYHVHSQSPVANLCIMHKSNITHSELESPRNCLFILYELPGNISASDYPYLTTLLSLNCVDVGNTLLYEILTAITDACPDLYNILETQYRLILTQNFLDALQNGYHVRMRDLHQAISNNLEKKCLIIEPSTNQEDLRTSAKFFEELPEHSKIIFYMDKCPIYYGKIFRKDMGMCLIIPIYRFGEIVEFLVIGNCHDKIPTLLLSAIHTVVSALCIEYEMRESVFTVVNRSRNGLMDAITNSGQLTPATITEWAELLGFKPKHQYIVIYLEFDLTAAATKTEHAVYYEILEFMIHYYHPDDYYFLRAFSDSLYIVGQFPSDSADKAQKRAVETCLQIEHLLKTKNLVKKMYSGIGTTQQQISDISQSYQDAVMALKIAHSTERSLIQYENLGILRLLGNIPGNESLENYVPASLKKLQEYDQHRQTNLVHTLSVYYATSCNASKSAQKLYIHYKTMLNRLERISQIMECDFNDRQTRLEIEMGLQILQLTRLQTQ